MKTTKSMTFTPSTEARELLLFTVNHTELYRRSIMPVIESLQKKYNKGTYQTEKAITAFYHVATEASKLYAKDFGYLFTVTERFTAACDLEAYFIDEITNK